MDARVVAPGFPTFQQGHSYFVPGLSHPLEEIQDATRRIKKILSTQVCDNVINVLAEE